MDIREVTTRDERLPVYRFRYEIYVEEMNRHQAYADHRRRTIEEPLDEFGHILAAFEDGHVIGTIRNNFTHEGDVGYYTDLYGMHDFAPFHPGRTCLTTKLMVAPQYRSGSLGPRLCKASYVFGIAAGIQFDFIDCNPPLKSFFIRMGYRQLRPDIVHPEYGQVHPMVLVTRDTAHLRSVDSPFAALVSGPDDGSVAFFHTNILLAAMPALA